MRKLFTYLLFSIFILQGYGQQKPIANRSKSKHPSNQKSSYIAYNSWINFSSNGALSDQQYYKIPITKEGIYRINFSALTNANIPVNSRSEEHTSELQSLRHLVCRLLL